MIKIDLHIHTSPSKYETQFTFSTEKLSEYIKKTNLDIIAITNHNHFDKEQFNILNNEMNCVVLPGVEVDIEKSHLLIIVSKDRVEELSYSCEQLSGMIENENDSISFEQFIQIFPNYRDYILIPHLKKNPVMKVTTLNKFNNLIKTGEVRSAKSFESTKKEANTLIPVLFSDIRIDESMSEFPTRFTYLDVNNMEFSVLKNALVDKEKVYITSDKKSDEFTFLNDGTTASTKLNVVIGKRSSGKTYNLKQIFCSKEEKSNNIRYIKQFSLTGKSEEDKFNELVQNEQQQVIKDYLEPIRKLTDVVLEIDEKGEEDLDSYLSSLKSFASSQSLQDAYSKSAMFNEIEYTNHDYYDTVKVINAVIVLLNSEQNKDIISKYISHDKILELINELIARRGIEQKDTKLKDETNKIVRILKEKLTSKSSMVNISPVNFFEIEKERIIINEYNRICNKLKECTEIYNLDVYRFTLKIKKKEFKNSSEVKKALRTNVGISSIFTNNYSNPYKFVCELKNIGIASSEIYKGLLSFDVKVYNINNHELSGGERAEYNLLREIKDADRYDVLLLDEPEASFDNIFIKEYIIDIIKNISQKTTVFITTHNNSLGMTIKPNKIIYTSNEKDGFKVYSGEFGSKCLTTVNNDSLMSYKTIMEVMEAGDDAYEERKGIYESFKN